MLISYLHPSMWTVMLCNVLVMMKVCQLIFFFFFQAEDGIRDAQESRGLGDVYKRQIFTSSINGTPFDSAAFD